MALRTGTRVHGTVKRRRAKPSGPSSFALDVRAWVDKAKGRMDLVIQKVSIELLSSVIVKSPVGNPEKWAANAHAIYGRETHNLFVEQINLLTLSEPANLTRGGNLKPGLKARRLGQKKLKQTYPLAAGRGYVGGRMKGSWIVSINRQPVGEPGRIDPKGDATLSAGTAVAMGAKAGDVIFIQSNVPYAIELEYGHSTQAPAGMVGITVVRFQQIVEQAIREAKGELP